MAQIPQFDAAQQHAPFADVLPRCSEKTHALAACCYAQVEFPAGLSLRGNGRKDQQYIETAMLQGEQIYRNLPA